MEFYCAYINISSPLGHLTMVVKSDSLKINFMSGLNIYCYKIRHDKWRIGFKNETIPWYEVYTNHLPPTLETMCQYNLIRNGPYHSHYATILYEIATTVYFGLEYEFQ